MNDGGGDDPQLSYPPVFRRQQTTTTTTEPASPPPPPQVAAPPVIDLEDPDMEILREACKEWGFFRVANHGVPTSLIRQLKSLAMEFFQQPFESKKLEAAGGDGSTNSSYFWGTPALTGSSGRPVETKEVNWVEGVHFSGLSQFGSSSPSIHHLRTAVEEYGEHAGRIARKLVEAMGELLGVDQCGAYVAESTGIVRVYRYPPTPAQTAAAPPLGMHPHTDSSLLSVLLEDDKVSGLQFIKDDNTADVDGGGDPNWLTVQPVPDTLLVNIGDMIQAISSDEFKSVKHRVKVEKSDAERISICYFVFPEEGKIIESSNYKPFTYREFHQQVVEDTKNVGFKVGLERFKRVS